MTIQPGVFHFCKHCGFMVQREVIRTGCRNALTRLIWKHVYNGERACGPNPDQYASPAKAERRDDQND